MNIRENLEQLEMEYLSPYAAHSKDSKGRMRMEEQCDIRPVYQSIPRVPRTEHLFDRANFQHGRG